MIQQIKSRLKNKGYEILQRKGLVPAAILLPLMYTDMELSILFTKRSQQVKHHKGEISFPGGMLDKSDKDFLGCALRECEEEVGIKEQDVQILGQLDDFKTVATHFIVTPFVGFVPHPYPFRINSREIDEVFIAPISYLLDKKNYESKRMDGPDGQAFFLDYFYYKDHVIWGATGYILKKFLHLAFDFDPNPGQVDPHELLD